MFKRSLLAVVLVALLPVAQAATVEVSWNDPQGFRDIRTTNGGQQRFQASVMSELEQQFQHEAAARLQEGQVLTIAVDDIDLAGEIEYFYTNYPFGLRVIRNVDFPQMTLSYELRDADGKLVKSGTEKLADLGFRFSTLTQVDRSALRYEKQMIKEWAQQSF
jgi:opacity protein-like surface antigen